MTYSIHHTGDTVGIIKVDPLYGEQRPFILGERLTPSQVQAALLMATYLCRWLNQELYPAVYPANDWSVGVAQAQQLTQPPS
jgi:hypothetical protein